MLLVEFRKEFQIALIGDLVCRIASVVECQGTEAAGLVHAIVRDELL